MVILSTSDIFDIKVSSLLADYDRETITNLYQPIIGFTALAVYFTFWSEAKNQKVTSMSSHEQLLLRMKMATGEFIEARKILEAVGLVKTRLEKMNGMSIYHYELFAPKTPSKFFNDTLLYGLLIQNLGENDANRLKRVYEISGINEQGEDISSSFNDVFHPNYEDAAFIKASSKVNNTLGRKKSKIDTEFSYEKFFKYLGEISQISEKSITKYEMKEVERIAALYGVNEEITAEKVANAFSTNLPKGSRIDFKQLDKDLKNEVDYGVRSIKRSKTKNIVIGEEGLAAKIKFFETSNPKSVLTALQNGTKPAMADLNIVRSLSEDYHLPNGVINVLIDFVLTMNNNVLSKYSVEKLASSLSREGIETAVDAMQYLNNNYASSNKKTIKSKSENKKINNNKQKEEQSDILSEEEMAELLEEFKDR